MPFAGIRRRLRGEHHLGSATNWLASRADAVVPEPPAGTVMVPAAKLEKLYELVRRLLTEGEWRQGLF